MVEIIGKERAPLVKIRWFESDILILRVIGIVVSKR